jgi:ribosome-associated translation inhibitor RaiA
MLVQVFTDDHIKGTEKLNGQVEAEVGGVIGRYGEQITRVEVYLSDLNAKKGGIDKRCLMEARIAGHQPLAVSHEAATLDEAITGAAEKLERSLDHTLGKLGHHKGNTSMGGDQKI